MKIPVITGTGRRLELDSDGMPRLIVAEACAAIGPQLWEMFVDPADDRTDPVPQVVGVTQPS